LTHTSGFGYLFTDSLLATHDTTGWNYEDLPRRFEAGTQFLYGTSLDWIGKLIEKISGLTLEDYFRIHITGPLKMNRTWYNVPDSLKTEIVSYGTRQTEGSEEISEFSDRIPETKTKVFIGGSRMFSSPEDYTRLLACLLNDGIYDGGQLLQKTTIDEMFKDQTKSISMDIENNYFKVGYCCDFRGLIKPTSKWGLGGLIDTETTSYGRQEGTLLWGGVYNTYWYIDRKSGIAASIYTQYLPFNHSETTTIFDKFSEIIYANSK
jgi:CubicO group peptidase (beta-lactamase class C family)